MNAAYDELKRQLAEITDLRNVAELLQWDQEVMMPAGGAASRANQLATLSHIAHDRFVSDEIGRLLEELRPFEESLPYESDEASLVRVTRRDWEKARRVPAELEAEMAKLSSEAVEAWVAARRDDDYAAFRPWLDRQLELKHRYLDCFEPAGDPYDVLLDDYEPGMRTHEVETVFARLKEVLIPLVAETATDEREGFLGGPFPEERQHELSLHVLERMGYTPTEFRLDRTVHPFCARSSPTDVRLTTRYADDDLNSLWSALHECGHGLYEHGVSPTLVRTPLAVGASSALHESQSRLWENLVGRSLPFWRWLYPTLRQTFPDVLDGIEVERFHRAANCVRRSYIRVDADETTYGLHIVLRFELERELLSGALSTRDLPEAWNARFEQYLGLPVSTNRDGVLQDVHWSGGSFGYFPTYQLGNVVSVQIFERARQALPDLDAQLAQGELGELHEWLREHVYAWGRKLTPQELLERVVDGPLDPEPYVAYITEKAQALAAV